MQNFSPVVSQLGVLILIGWIVFRVVKRFKPCLKQYVMLHARDEDIRVRNATVVRWIGNACNVSDPIKLSFLFFIDVIDQFQKTLLRRWLKAVAWFFLLICAISFLLLLGTEGIDALGNWREVGAGLAAGLLICVIAWLPLLACGPALWLSRRLLRHSHGAFMAVALLSLWLFGMYVLGTILCGTIEPLRVLSSVPLIMASPAIGIITNNQFEALASAIILWIGGLPFILWLTSISICGMLWWVRKLEIIPHWLTKFGDTKLVVEQRKQLCELIDFLSDVDTYTVIASRTLWRVASFFF